MKRIAALVVATLREIFDESAYRRFLERTGRQPSRAAWEEFLSEHAAGKCKRPKCC
jgi:hypothetical protein